MNTKDFYYELPEELIAQTPLEDRAASRLLKLDKNSGEVEHNTFRDILKYLKKGDCIVMNDSRVIPARLYGVKINDDDDADGAEVEFLLLKRIDVNTWEVILKPGRRAKVGSRFSFGEGKLFAEVLDIVEEGKRVVKFEFDGIWEEVLNELGEMPLPPYIKEKLIDNERYQTVYSKVEGSAAAPTAGLHFTEELMKQVEDMGVKILFLTLHVGLGTFRPVTAEEIEKHHMHAEEFSITEEVAQEINEIRANGGRIVAIGTTSVRVLESCVTDDGKVFARTGETDIFLYPPYKFRAVDGLITNFHLPESTLVMLVSCLAGRENILNAYNEAVNEKYRFFSFGDAMLII
ncbi:MAG: tRNA preQ1(34) S-adenosylmethionine ribosyltransferase-isomerase QueA [Oscillospiraceae bacterium]|nr:tRNA preQ1(34) S-adenosylmethionine ribosyltransferase-isomerase QueA [Oscillospiraceae bacterium]